MTFTERNGIAITQIVIFLPSLFIAIWLSRTHGFGRNAGWLYLIFFSLIRIVGAALQLATISDEKNLGLYIGSTTLAGIGLSPLILVQLGLLGRALTSIRKKQQTFLNERQLRLVQLLVVVGLILGAVGGGRAGADFAKTKVYVVPTESKAGIAVTIVAYVILVLSTIIVATQISHAEAGEKRLVLAVGLSLPFILIRLVYAAMSTLANNPSFSSLTGDANIQLGMAVIMEIIVVIIVEAIGLTLKKVPKAGKHAVHRGGPDSAHAESGRYLMADYQNNHGMSHHQTSRV